MTLNDTAGVLPVPRSILHSFSTPQPGPVQPRFPVTAENVISFVSGKFLVDEGELLSRKRDKITAFARQIAMYLLRQHTDWTLGDIGSVLGNRRPATVSYAYQQIATARTYAPWLDKLIAEFNWRG